LYSAYDVQDTRRVDIHEIFVGGVDYDKTTQHSTCVLRSLTYIM